MYLISFLDNATRVVPYAAFALGENVRLLHAHLRAGDPGTRDPDAAFR
jgi:hypothetical protein